MQMSHPLLRLPAPTSHIWGIASVLGFGLPVLYVASATCISQWGRQHCPCLPVLLRAELWCHHSLSFPLAGREIVVMS